MGRDAVPNVRLQRLIESRGWTQSHTAARINAEHERITGRLGRYSDESIRRMERGSITWPTAPYREAMRSIFDVAEDSELGFHCTRTKNRATADSTRSDAALTDEEDDLRRIDFLRGLAALSGSVLTGGGLIGTLDDAAAQSSIPRRIGSDHVMQVRNVTRLFRTADNLGHGITREAMFAQMKYAVQLLGAHADPRTLNEMHIAVGALAEVIGWSHFDNGHHRAADRYFRAGLHCADTAGSWWLRADILSDMARQAIYLGRHDEALTLLGAAKVREDRLSSLRRANLSAVQARAFGALGEVRECVRSVSDAEQFFFESRTDSRDEPDFADFAKYFCHAQLKGDTGHGLYVPATHGHEVGNARERLSEAIAGYPAEYARSRLFCLTRLATLLLRRGDLDEAVVIGQQALTEARLIRSVRAIDDIRELHTSTAGKQRGREDVAELRRNAAQLMRLTV